MKSEKEKKQKKLILHDTGMVTWKKIKHMRMTMRISIIYYVSTLNVNIYDMYVL